MMTLRYTEITLETVGEEYHAALTKMETRYRIALEETPTAELDPDSALERHPPVAEEEGRG